MSTRLYAVRNAATPQIETEILVRAESLAQARAFAADKFLTVYRPTEERLVDLIKNNVLIEDATSEP